MFTVTPCVAPIRVIGCEVGSPKLISLSPKHPKTESLDERIPTANVVSHRLESSTSQASSPILDDHSSPISTLLEELLIIIFDDVITSESFSCPHRRTPTGSWLSSPRNLASVSRAWRATVFACPRLWRQVHLTPAQSIHALKEQLYRSSPFSIHLTVHQWPFRNPIPASGPYSIGALSAQLGSILSPAEKEGTTFAPASQRVESITINATESSTFLDLVFQSWTGRSSKFPVLRHVAIDGNVCATWSRACFFDGRNAPGLSRLELNNVVIAHDAYRLAWGMRSNLTTLVWSASVHKRGSLIVSVSCFHHVVSSFPSLTTLELCGHVVALEFVTLESLEESGITPLVHIRDLRLSGWVFPNARAAYILFHLLPSLRHVAVRGRACSGPPEQRTVTHALQGMINLPKLFGWPTVLPSVENLELDCVEDTHGGSGWEPWCIRELELWSQWQDGGKGSSVARMRMQMVTDDDLLYP